MGRLRRKHRALRAVPEGNPGKCCDEDQDQAGQCQDHSSRRRRSGMGGSRCAGAMPLAGSRVIAGVHPTPGRRGKLRALHRVQSSASASVGAIEGEADERKAARSLAGLRNRSRPDEPPLSARDDDHLRVLATSPAEEDPGAGLRLKLEVHPCAVGTGEAEGDRRLRRRGPGAPGGRTAPPGPVGSGYSIHGSLTHESPSSE